MKKLLLPFFALLCFVVNAQTTFDIDWEVGVNGAAASATVEPGDTVRWTWTDALPHSVTSESNSQEAFDSGIITGMGTQFSFTFTQEGLNDYKCDVHSNMFGTITVEEQLSVQDKFVKSLKFYPNPAQDELNVFSLFKIDRYQVHNSLGQLVDSSEYEGNFASINVSSFRPGIYYVEVYSGTMSHVTSIVVQ